MATYQWPDVLEEQHASLSYFFSFFLFSYFSPRRTVRRIIFLGPSFLVSKLISVEIRRQVNRASLHSQVI